MTRKPKRNEARFSRRERQVMDIIYRLGEGAVGEILAELPDPPSYSAIRSTLSILVDKGHLAHRQENNRYLYYPTVSRGVARGRALSHLVETFFDASPTELVSTLLESRSRMSSDDLDELARLIDEARGRASSPRGDDT